MTGKAGKADRRLRRALGALAVVLVATGAVGSPAGADRARTPSVAVRPDTDLVDDQRVRVRGEGWRPETFLVIAQCDARATSFKGCDGSFVILLLASGDTWGVTFRVSRGIDTEEFGRLDCAAEPGACVIGVLARPGRVLAEAPLHFDPEGPPPPPELALDLDLDETVQLLHGGRGARVEVDVVCQPGQHVFVELQLAQDQGEQDVVGFGATEIDRCHGTAHVGIEVRATDGGTFQPGEGFAIVSGFGFRDPEEDGTQDTEFADITFVA